MSQTSANRTTDRAPRRAGALFLALELAALAAAGWVWAATDGTDRWQVGALVSIALFTFASDFLSVRAATGVIVSGSFVGIILVAVTLGGGPASLLAAATILVGWLRSREKLAYLLNNVVSYVWFPLITAIAFHRSAALLHTNSRSLTFYLLVFGAFLVALSCNVIGIFGVTSILDRKSFRGKVRDHLVPLLPAELASGLLTAGAAYVYYHAGTAGLILCALVFVVYLYLVGAMLTSQRRSVALQRAATTDDLTGLANRERFRYAVDKRIATATATGSVFAVMLVDLDHFKEINDALGHHYGDAMLRELGPRLVETVGPAGLVARLGGDEFGILIGEDTDDPTVLELFVAGLIQRIGEPFTVDELSLEVGASVGVARFPQDGGDAHALLRCADIAMYSAKEAQLDYKIYTEDQNRQSAQRLSVLNDIRQALATDDQIVVHFQPIIDLDDLSVRGAEGLVRWQHPEHGLIPPGMFVSTVEQTSLIGPLTRRVLEHSIAECAGWRRAGHDLSVAVNLSVRNLLDRELPQQVSTLLDTYRLPADALQLEITESMIMSDPERALATVARLSGLGVRLSVDDFGTGYSSLANLRKMPITELKIDRSFVSPMLHDESDLIIVRSTINLGHDLGLHVIAEGVEDRQTLERLALLGCDLAQGYHVSRPVPADAFTEWLGDGDVFKNAATETGRRKLPVASSGG